MAIYRYGGMDVPELPASDLPYVHVYGTPGYFAYAFFSSEPFIAMDVMSGLGVSLMGRYGYNTMAATSEEATVECYSFDYETGWVKTTDFSYIANSSTGGNSYGGENGKMYFMGGSLQSHNSWCNHDILWLPNTVVQQASDDPFLVKETFPIKAFTELLMAGVEASSAFPMPGSGGDS